MGPRACLAVLLAAACHRGPPPSTEQPQERPKFTTCCPRLEVEVVSSVPDDARGGLAVVHLHGFGQEVEWFRDSAVALARQAPLRVFLPGGPQRHRQGGRAWWNFVQEWPGEMGTADEPAPDRPPPQLVSARVGVQQLLRAIRDRYRPEALVLTGFSQGAMLAIDVAAAADPPVDRVVVMSGALLADSLPGVRAPRAARPPVFITHGRGDTGLKLFGAELMEATLRKNGFAVTIRPFDGGHVLPPPPLFTELVGFVVGPDAAR